MYPCYRQNDPQDRVDQKNRLLIEIVRQTKNLIYYYNNVFSNK